MADNGGGNSFLGFVLGGVVVVLVLFGFLIFGGALPITKTVKVDTPAVIIPK